MINIVLKPVKVYKNNVKPEILGNQFIYHEFLKIFRDIKDKSFRRKIKRSVNNFIKRDGPHHYWLLLAALAEGWRVKRVFYNLSNPAYVWRLEKRKISDLYMTGFNPRPVDKLIDRCGHDFYKFADYYHKNPDFFRKYMPNLKPRPERDKHPVFVFWQPEKRHFRLFDGMRRTSLAAIRGEKYINVYVGYPEKKGKPMINADKIHIFNLIFAKAKKDKKTFKAFKIVGREIVRQFGNGRQLVKVNLKPWASKWESRLIKEIIKR
ncbi:MAG: hypothetical protein ABIE03_01465 [Patescibacteria group bacterium]